MHQIVASLSLFIASAIFLSSHRVAALNNGLVRTPPMGWLSWERFRCNTDCENDPENCISEKLFMTMADIIVKEGYKDAGYEYVNIDDCWLARSRTASGQLAPDPGRFPSGMKALSDYMHSRGLKLGIYEDFGTKTCAGYPGSEYYLQMDAQTFADWGIDYLKLDGCNSESKQYVDQYPPVAFFLNKTGRPIVLSCEYAVHLLHDGYKVNYTQLGEACNLCRNGHDIQDSWESLTSIINLYKTNQYNFAEAAGPGFFNDPDMLVIGNYGLSFDQQRVQMALWSIMASPLIMSVDLRTISSESKALLQNKGAISINQDPLGVQGTYKKSVDGVDVWTKKIMPRGSFAFAFVYMGDGGKPIKASVRLTDIGLTGAAGYNVSEVFDSKSIGKMLANDTLNVYVNPSGVFFGKAIMLG